MVDQCWQDAARHPVPQLEVTMKKYLEAFHAYLKPKDALKLCVESNEIKETCDEDQLLDCSLSDEELAKRSAQFENTRRIVKEFLEGDGPFLQQDLQDYALTKENWTFENFVNNVWLKRRDPLILCGNAWLLLPKQQFDSDNRMLYYTTQMIKYAVNFKQQVDNKTLSQDLGTGPIKGCPLCMNAYKSLFYHTRRPQLECDKIINPQGSEEPTHIIVASCNQFYSLDLGKKFLNNPDLNDSEISLKIFSNLKYIYRISRQNVDNKQDIPKIGLLTTLDRDTWANVRTKLIADKQFTDTMLKENEASLKQIEDSLFVVCLDSIVGAQDNENLDIYESSYESYTQHGFQSKKEHAHATFIMNYGLGPERFAANRWFDKSIQFIIHTSGYCGINMEHSGHEGLSVARLLGECNAFANRTDYSSLNMSEEDLNGCASSDNVSTLKWNLNEEIRIVLEVAETNVDKLIEKHSFYILNFDEFGSNYIKKLKVSPDAFVMLAAQYAHYKCHGFVELSAEAGALKQFKFGRDGIIRPNTIESLAWIQSMLRMNRHPVGSKEFIKAKLNARRMFHVALNKQVQNTRDTVNGLEPDNHLNALAEMEAARKPEKSSSLFTDDSHQVFWIWKFGFSNLSNKYNMTISFCNFSEDSYACAYAINPESIELWITSDATYSKTCERKLAHSMTECFKEMKSILLS